MKKKQLNALIEKFVEEALQEARSQSRHYRKSKIAQKIDKTLPAPPKVDPNEERMLGALTQVLATIDQFPPMMVPSPDPKNPKKQIMLPNKQHKAMVTQAAEKILNHLPVSKKELDTLGRFILASRALPKVPLSIILRGLVRIFEKEV